MRPSDDVIAAIATPIGEGGIAVIRMSGTGAIKAADHFFRGTQRLVDVPSHTLHFGIFAGLNGEDVDEVVISVFKGPRSYTGEDVVEISCHGGALLSRKILHELIAGGARMAEPGEFTRRAFMNGRIDLSQAEAVSGLIQARSEVFLKASLCQLQGKLSGRVAEIRQRLTKICGLLEIELDFAEENAIFIRRPDIENAILEIIDLFERLVAGYNVGRLYREGVKIVLLGMPNVGKSSILNSLLNEDRAIVTDVPGTTRDTIEESLGINGVSCRIIDTAGIRDSKDVIEAEGVQRTMNELRSADIVLLVLSATEKRPSADIAMFSRIENAVPDIAQRAVLIINKVDLVSGEYGFPFESKFGKPIRLSAKTGSGLDSLKQAIYDRAVGDEFRNQESDIVITNQRHKNCLVQAIQSLRSGQEALEKGLSEEFIVVDIRRAADSIGEIIGEVRSEEILDSIFSSFCIGK